MKNLQRLRRALAALVIAGAGVAAAVGGSVADLPVALNKETGVQMHYYVVQPRETVYSLANRLGITTEELYAANPAAREGLQAYQTLWFPISAEQKARGREVRHEVKRGETVYGLSKLYGVSVEELVAQNPSANEGLRAGDVIVLNLALEGYVPEPEPVAQAEEPVEQTVVEVPGEGPVVELPVADEQAPPMPPADELMPAPAPAAPTAALAAVENPVIAVVLPFMLTEEKPSKSAQRFTEFFQGMLVAADTLKRGGSPVTIKAFDSQGKRQAVAALIADGSLDGADVVVAPDDEAQLRDLAAWADSRTRGPLLINCFMVRDTLQQTSPHVMQSYTPTPRLQAKAARGLVDEWGQGRKLVVVTRQDGPTDQKAFVDQLAAEARSRGMEVEELAFSERLKDTDLEPLAAAGGGLVFVAPGADQPEANRILPAIADFAEQHPMTDVMVWGHPKWITFRGETLDNMHRANTVVYNRFFADPEGYGAQGVEQAFSRWFGTEMDKAVPRPGLMGFDTGSFLINGLRRGTLLPATDDTAAPLWRGVQNGFSFERVAPGAGLANTMVYLVNYRPGGVVERLEL